MVNDLRNYLIGYLREGLVVRRCGVGSVNSSLKLPKGTPIIFTHQDGFKYTAEYWDAANKLVEIKAVGSVFRNSDNVEVLQWIRVKPLQ